MDEIEQITQPQPAKKPSRFRNLLWLLIGIVVIVVVAVGSFLGIRAYQNRNVWAKVGNFVISQDEFQQVQSDLKKIPFDIGLDASQVDAKDKPAGPVLIFNAALKTEANKQNVGYSDQDLNAFIKQSGQYKQYKDLTTYFIAMQKQNSWSESTARKVLEINYLQPKLAKKMLAVKDYEAIIIRWDNIRLATNDVKKAEDAVALRMNTEYLPQFQKSANSDQIAKSADISQLKTEAENNKVLRDNPIAFSAFKTYKGVNDSDIDTMFQNYPEGTKNSVELRKLQKVGEYTPVFKSATGYYAIFRLEGVNKGEYESYQKLFDVYVPKSTELSIVPNVSKIDLFTLLSKVLYSITPRAEAADDCLSGHRIAFHTHWIDQDTGAEIGGGSINANSARKNTLCNPDGYYARDGQDWAHGAVGSDGFYAVGTNKNFGSGYEIFNLDCNGPTWNFNFTAPGGYDLGQQPIDPATYPGFGQFARTENGSWLFPGVINSSAWTMPSWYYAGTNGETWEIKIYIKKKPTYLGRLSVQKYMPPNHPLGTNSNPVIPDIVKNATVRFSNDNGEFTNGDGGGNNSVANNLWVDWLTPYNNGWRPNGYRVTVDVPVGYRVTRWEIQSDLGTPYPNRYGGDGNTVGGIYVVNGGTVWVDFFFERLPNHNLESIDCNRNGVVTGWVQIPDDSNGVQGSDVHLYIDKTPGPGVAPNAILNTSQAEQYDGKPIYRFSYVIPNNLKDGNAHTVRAYSFLSNGTPFELFGSPKTFTCTSIPTVSYPWIQTQKGDVTSLRSISGQDRGEPANINEKPGARRKDSVFTESDYVVTAALSGTDFCSNNRYVLGKGLTGRNDCQTGGYTPSPVNFEDVKNALNNAWSRNGAGAGLGASACKPYITSGITSFNPNLSLGTPCKGGSIQRAGGNFSLGYAGSILTITGGKGTLWVQGDLTINSNIVYSSAGVLDINTLPNLVIFVEGDVKIDQGVTQIDASIVSMKSINSCTQSATTGPACSLALVNNGYWATANSVSGSFNNFSRRKFDKNNPNGVPAELLILTPQSIVFPPPGLDQSDADINSQLQINSGELAPRLN